MEGLVSLLVFSQALGAVTGVFSALFGEGLYIRAMRNNRIDIAERLHLLTSAKGLRYGMSLLLLSSFGLVILSYVTDVPVQPALTASYWSFMALALLVIGVSWAFSKKKVSFALASAPMLCGWIFLAYLALTREEVISFGTTVAFYVIATGVLYALLQYIRMFLTSELKASV